MRLKTFEYELIKSIAFKMYDSSDFQDYEAEFISTICDNVKINKKQLKKLTKINNN